MGLQLQRGKFIKTRIVLFITIAIALLAVPFSAHLQTPKAYADESDFETPRFINSPHYVRANTVDDGNPATLDDHDIAVEIEFYEGTERIDLYIDDQPVGEPANTLDQTALNQGDQIEGEEGANKIIVRMPFAPGLHTVRGVAYLTDGSHTDIDGPSIVYALDAPTAEYVTPTTEQQAFKTSTNPVKVKIDDEFSQFANAEFALFRGTSENPGESLGAFTLSRAECDATEGGFIYCNLDQASGWPSLDEGTYFVKLKTSTKAETSGHSQGIAFEDQTHWSHSFVVDNTAPVVTIGGPLSVVGGEHITVSGTIGTSAVEATVYVDGEPSGVATLDGAGKWAYDLKADLSIGDHKVSVSAKDAAENTSDSEVSETTLTVQPFMPPAAAVTPVAALASGLTDPFPTIKESVIELNQASSAKGQASDIGALDKKTMKTPVVDQNAVLIASTAEGWKLFGIAWYWLLLIPAVLGGVAWLIGKIRAPQEMPSFIADPEDV
jgi:hypothetical protein